MDDQPLINHVEIWKPIPLNPRFEASEFGHLRRSKDGKIIGQHLDSNGYFAATIGLNGNRIRTNIAVCSAFHGPKPTSSHVACHRNGVRSDNRATNLKWGTQKENIHDKYAHGTMGFGELNGFAKLTERSVKEIRHLCLTGMTQKEIAGLYGVTQATVSLVFLRKVWSHTE